MIRCIFNFLLLKFIVFSFSIYILWNEIYFWYTLVKVTVKASYRRHYLLIYSPKSFFLIISRHNVQLLRLVKYAAQFWFYWLAKSSKQTQYRNYLNYFFSWLKYQCSSMCFHYFKRTKCTHHMWPYQKLWIGGKKLVTKSMINGS